MRELTGIFARVAHLDPDSIDFDVFFDPLSRFKYEDITQEQHEQLVISHYIWLCCSEFLNQENPQVFKDVKNLYKKWGNSVFFIPRQGNGIDSDVFHEYNFLYIIKEGLVVKNFFKYVLSQEDLPVDELDLIYEFLAKNHVSALAEKEYNKYKNHYGWPERYFLPDEPIEGAVEDGEDAAREEILL